MTYLLGILFALLLLGMVRKGLSSYRVRRAACAAAAVQKTLAEERALFRQIQRRTDAAAAAERAAELIAEEEELERQAFGRTQS